jgi:serine/threonine protein kinase
MHLQAAHVIDRLPGRASRDEIHGLRTGQSADQPSGETLAAPGEDPDAHGVAPATSPSRRPADRGRETLAYAPRDEAADAKASLPPPAPTVSVGDLIADKYRVESVLGEGGMCVVYGARRIHFDDRVAIKVLRYELTGQSAMVSRFLREGKASTRIRSHHVVRVIDVGTLPAGPPYLVLEFLEGQDLDAVLSGEGRLPITVAVDFVLQAGEAIAEAHHLGIVHRDLKPANLFLTANADGTPFVKVFDFGISKLASDLLRDQDLDLTDATSVIGSPQYMSPEQLRSARDVDGRADLWSLGAILFELATGGTPFQAESVPELCASVLREEPIAMTTLRADCPRKLERVVMRCLEKDPAARFQDMAELAKALAPFASAAGLLSVRRITGTNGDVVRGSSPSFAPGSIRPSLEPFASKSLIPTAHGPRGLTIALAALVLAGAVVTVVGPFQSKPVPAAAASSEALPAAASEPSPTTAMPEEIPSPVEPTFEVPENPNRAHVPPMQRSAEVRPPSPRAAATATPSATVDASKNDLDLQFGHRK